MFPLEKPLCSWEAFSGPILILRLYLSVDISIRLYITYIVRIL